MADEIINPFYFGAVKKEKDAPLSRVNHKFARENVIHFLSYHRIRSRSCLVHTISNNNQDTTNFFGFFYAEPAYLTRLLWPFFFILTFVRTPKTNDLTLKKLDPWFLPNANARTAIDRLHVCLCIHKEGLRGLLWCAVQRKLCTSKIKCAVLKTLNIEQYVYLLLLSRKWRLFKKKLATYNKSIRITEYFEHFFLSWF